jgi:hypothetical protein
MLSTILLIILIILLIGALPTWPYSGGWGYYPSSGLGLLGDYHYRSARLGSNIASGPERGSAGSTRSRPSPQYLDAQWQRGAEPKRKSGVIRDAVVGERVHKNIEPLAVQH